MSRLNIWRVLIVHCSFNSWSLILTSLSMWSLMILEWVVKSKKGVEKDSEGSSKSWSIARWKSC